MIPGVLSRCGLAIRTAAIGPNIAEIRRELTVITPSRVGPPKETRLYSVPANAQDYTRLPRTYINEVAGIDVRWGHTNPAEFVTSGQIELHPGQTRLIDTVLPIFTAERCSAGTAAAVVTMRAGQGKTFVACAIAAAIGRRTLCIVPRKILVTQFTADAGRYFDTHSIEPIVINTALKKPREFFSDYDLVIFDEVHTYCSEKRRRIFHLASAPYVLCMSATTSDRLDGLDVVYTREFAFDGVLSAEEDRTDGFTGTVRAVYYHGPPEFTQVIEHESTGLMFMPSMIAQFLADERRTAVIIAEIAELCSWRGELGQRHCIYVFCDMRDPLTAMAARIESAICEHCACIMIGGVTDDEVAEMKKTSRVFLTTYSYASTGLSIDKMSAIVFMTPRKSGMKQILARILRRSGDSTIERRVVDIIDAGTPVRYQFKSREKAYKEYGFKVSAVHRR